MKSIQANLLSMKLEKKIRIQLCFLFVLLSGLSFGQIVINNPTPISLCDDPSHDGFEIFDLTSKNSEILANNDPNLFSIAYYTQANDPQNSNVFIALPQAYLSDSNWVYVKVYEIANANNFVIKTLDLQVIDLQLVNQNKIIHFETPFDGFSVFDLTVKNSQIANGYPEYYSFLYFLTFNDAQNNSGPIVNPTSYTNVSNNQTIYVRVTSTDPMACYEIVNLDLKVLDQSLRPIIQMPTTANLCDIDNNGYESFDVTTKNSEILASNSSSLYYVGYYNSLENAENNIDELISQGFTNYMTSLIYVRVHENINVDNYSITTLNIDIDPIPVANTVNNLFVYENPFDGIGTFNLSDVNALLFGNQSGFISKFYLSQSDASNDTNPLSNITSYVNTLNQQIVWVRVFNPANLNCFQSSSITSFKLVVVDTNDIINIPDASFKSALLATGIDTNNDGNIQHIEALQLNNLEIPSITNFADVILSYQGLTSFQNLISFKVTSNYSNTIDFSGMSNLKKIEIIGGQPIALNNFSGAQNVEILNVQQIGITNLDLSSLINLKTLTMSYTNLNSINVISNTQLTLFNCSHNNLTSIDISSLTNLSSFDCSNNHLTQLSLSNNSLLTLLICNFNLLTSLELVANVGLVRVECKYNALTTLNVNSNHNLKYLTCDHNSLANLDISNNPNLILLDCNTNQISNLSLFQNSMLVALICDFNQLTTLDISHNNYINTFYCSNNNLGTIFMKNGKSEIQIDFSGNNNLQYICVDQSQLSDIQNRLNNLGLTLTVCNDYCSFYPGGNFNTINGTVLFDANSNGCDSSDIQQPDIRIDSYEGTTHEATFTNNLGEYSFYTQTGSFIITPNVENLNWFNFSPSSTTIPFTDTNNNIASQNFCISPNGVHNDVEIVVVPVSMARPGFEATYKIVYKNIGNQMLSGSIGFNYMDTVSDFVSSTIVPNSQSNGLLSWNYTNLLPFENRTIFITLMVNSPTQTPPINIGDILNFSTSISSLNGDENPSNNTNSYSQTVVGSFDPNYKVCIEGPSVSTTLIGGYLHYAINFENIGAYTAENVVVKDIVDTTKFDISTLQVLNSSHPVIVRINGDIVEFVFKQINLDNEVHGTVLFKIKTKPSVTAGTQVVNKANVFFDYNAPIQTNEARTTFEALNDSTFTKDASILIAPNPAKDIVTVISNSILVSCQLFDVQGRLLEILLVNDVKTTIDVKERVKGVYFLKINSDKGSKVEKLIIE